MIKIEVEELKIELKRLQAAIEDTKTNGTHMNLPNLFKSDVEKANEERNSRKLEDVWVDIKNCYTKLNKNKDDLQHMYKSKITPFETIPCI